MSFNMVNHPSHRQLRQQTLNTVSHIFLFLMRCHGYDLGANRMRLPKLDEETVKVQPLLRYLLSNGLPNMGAGIGQLVRRMNRDLSKGSIFGWDGLECFGDPFDMP